MLKKQTQYVQEVTSDVLPIGRDFNMVLDLDVVESSPAGQYGNVHTAETLPLGVNNTRCCLQACGSDGTQQIETLFLLTELPLLCARGCDVFTGRAARLRGQEIPTVTQSHFLMQKGFLEVGRCGQLRAGMTNIRLVSWKDQWSLQCWLL